MISGARSGPSAATAMIAATTMSTGMTSTVPFGDTGELVEEAAGVGDQHGLGHAEAADPAGLGFGERRFDDRWPHDRHGHVALDVGERLLAECLGEGIGVGPADARGPGTSGFDELVLHPLLAELFGLRREGGSAGGAEFGAGLLAEALEVLRAAAGCVGVGAQPAARGHLPAPVDTDVERAVAHQLLGGVAASVACHVARRDRHEMWRDSHLVAEVGDARRPEQVDLDGRVERRIERDRCRRVDHGVAARKDRSVGVVQSEAVAGDVAGDRRTHAR